MNFAEKVENYRKNLGLTQEALAAKCSVTRQAVAKWEKGESMPDIYTIARLSRLFSVSIEDFIHTDDAVVETQGFYIRRLQEGDRDSLCSLMYEHGVLGRLYMSIWAEAFVRFLTATIVNLFVIQLFDRKKA